MKVSQLNGISLRRKNNSLHICRVPRHMWVEFVVGSRLCSDVFFFSGFSGFSVVTKKKNKTCIFSFKSISIVKIYYIFLSKYSDYKHVRGQSDTHVSSLPRDS